MRVQVSLTADNALVLPAAREIRALPDGMTLYHSARGWRHPLAIYTLSLQQVGERFRRVLDALDDPATTVALTKEGSPDGPLRELLERQDALLDAFMEHMDDCLKIVDCFIDPSANVGKHPRRKEYQKGISEYREHIGLVVNKIKHEHARLRGFAFHNPNDAIAGYYIEHIQDDGTVGPHPAIHDGGDTAFSFARDLRYHLVNLLLVSQQLATVISALVQDAGLTSDYSRRSERPEPGLLEPIRRVVRLPNLVFPDEYDEPWPSLGLTEPPGGVAAVTAEFPGGTDAPRPITQPMSVKTQFTGDNVSRKFRLPYFGERWRSSR